MRALLPGSASQPARRAVQRSGRLFGMRLTFASPSECLLPPLWPTAQPCLREDLSRGSTWAAMQLRAPRAAAGLRLDLPPLAIGADEDVTTPPQTLVSIPPVALDS